MARGWMSRDRLSRWSRELGVGSENWQRRDRGQVAARPLCLPRRALPAGSGVPKASAKGRQCGLGSEANKGHTPVEVSEAVSCYVITLPIGSGQPMHTLLRRNGIPISHRTWKWVLQGLCVSRLPRRSPRKVAQRQGGLWLLAQLPVQRKEAERTLWGPGRPARPCERLAGPRLFPLPEHTPLLCLQLTGLAWLMQDGDPGPWVLEALCPEAGSPG